jgi:hypothetical protein
MALDVMRAVICGLEGGAGLEEMVGFKGVKVQALSVATT